MSCDISQSLVFERGKKMQRENGWDLLELIDVSYNSGYPADRRPERGDDFCCTAKSEVHVTDAKGEVREFAPTLYRSSMNPDYKEIKTMKVEVKKKEEKTYVEFSSRYFHESVEVTGQSFQVLPWKAKIEKADCLHCCNCGRCGW